MMRQYVIFWALFLIPAPIWAGTDDARYQTPEYSGPSAKFDNGLEQYQQNRMRVQDAIRNQQQGQILRKNDTAADATFEQRLRRVQGEMDRRRDEVRGTYYKNRSYND